jgi:heptosyltransferase-2
VDSALDPKRVLIVAPNWVGDSIFVLPAVTALRRRFASAKFCLLAKPSIIALHRASPIFDSFEPLLNSGRWGRFVTQWELRKDRFDLAIVFPPSFSSALGAFLSGARVRVGRRGEGRGVFLNMRLPRAQRNRHVSEEYLDIARLLGAEAQENDKILQLPLTEEGIQERDGLFREAGLESGPRLIALCPTSAFGPSKCWDPENYAALARRLQEQGFQPFLLGAPDELDTLHPIAKEAGMLPILLPSLAGLAACLAAAGLVVANDSGPLHVAAAVGTRTVGLYGPIDPKWSAPMGAHSKVLYTNEVCSPCFKAVCPLGHHACMKNISPEAVMRALQELSKR